MFRTLVLLIFLFDMLSTVTPILSVAGASIMMQRMLDATGSRMDYMYMYLCVDVLASDMSEFAHHKFVVESFQSLSKI